MKMNGFSRLSEIVSAGQTSQYRSTSISNSYISQVAAMLGCTVAVLTAAEYAALLPKDSGTLYIATDGTVFKLYYGDKELDGGGGGGGEWLGAALLKATFADGYRIGTAETITA